MYTSKELLEIVNHYLDSLAYNRKPASLYEPIKYVLDLGGKRIRPILMLLSYNLYKDNPKDILSAACALETYHNYTLLHDDLMDEAPRTTNRTQEVERQPSRAFGRLYVGLGLRTTG